jgi:hypothetical protein
MSNSLNGDDMKNMNLRILGVILFIIGILAGFTINVLAVWADFEATMFHSAVPADESFPGLHCPLLIGKDQEGLIIATVKNSNDRTIEPTIRVNISEGSLLLMRESDEKVKIEPGETAELSWPITAVDAAWERFIAFRLYQYRSYPEPSRVRSCGVYVVNIPGMNGTTLTVGLYVVSLLGMGFGIWSWRQTHQPMQKTAKDIFAGMIFLAISITAGLFVNYFGLTLIGTLLLILALLTVVVIMAYLFSQL